MHALALIVTGLALASGPERVSAEVREPELDGLWEWELSAHGRFPIARLKPEGVRGFGPSDIRIRGGRSFPLRGGLLGYWERPWSLELSYDPTTRPKWIDLSWRDARGRRVTRKGIYRIGKDGSLAIHSAAPGKPRPRSFPGLGEEDDCDTDWFLRVR